MEHYWPPGFRFYPTEEELVSFYLHKKREGKPEHLNRLMDRVIPVLDLYEYNPWDLPQFSCYKDPEQWFFFVPRQEHEARRGRPRRLTTNGYWKATGSPGFVYSSKTGRPIGGKRTMVFYNGRAPNGKKTEWKMNEYKAIEAPDQQSSSSSSTAALLMLRKELSLCRVYKKSKCLRSFDRRPAAGVILRDPVPQPALINHVNDHPATIPPLRASSANSSSGGNPSQSGETIDIFMGIDDEWDWDKMLDMCE